MNNHKMFLENGFRVLTDPNMILTVTTKKKRSMFSRIFKGEFKRKYDVTVEKKPDSRIIIFEDRIVGHPETINQMMNSLEKESA